MSRLGSLKSNLAAGIEESGACVSKLFEKRADFPRFKIRHHNVFLSGYSPSAHLPKSSTMRLASSS